MKKFLTVVLCLGATVVSASAASNLLKNAGFETQGSDAQKATYWEWGNPNNHGMMYGSATRESWRYLSGSYEGTIRGSWASAGSTGGCWQESAVLPGKTYRFTALFWADDYGNKWTCTVQGIKLEFYSATTGLLYAVTNLIGEISQNWVGRTAQGVAPSNTAWARGVIYAAGVGGNGALQFDDVSLIEVPTNNIRIGPSSRRTGLVFSEIMYHPRTRADGKDLEFVELFNTVPVSKKLDGYTLGGDIEYVFPANTTMSGFSYLVVAKDPVAFQSVYGLSGVLGPYTGNLSNASGELELLDALGGKELDVEYTDQPPWPAAADGAGHSIVLWTPSYGEGDPRAWGASFYMGGSPGNGDVVIDSPRNGVMVNEVLAHTDPPEVDYIELYNSCTQAVDLTGCYLTDDPETNKYRFPATNIAAKGFLVVTTNEMGFSLSSHGETVFLKNSNDTRVIDCMLFGGTENGVSFGRAPDGSPEMQDLVPPATPGTTNRAALLRDIVINEIMYHPISDNSDDEYIELFNRGSSNVDVSLWQLADGITFTIPQGTVIGSSNYLVVARNQTHLRSVYTNLTAANTVGDYSGSLADGGERVVLLMPHDAQTLVEIDEVTYADGGRWGLWSDGKGSSLELKDPHSDNRLASNWADSDETGKSSWTNVTFTGLLDNGMNAGSGAIDELHLLLLGRGECLVDNVVVSNAYGSGNLIANSTFESGLSGWTLEGNLVRSVLETNGYSSARSLHVKASGGGDTGANRIKTSLAITQYEGYTCTISAQARWLRGNPYLLMRLRGNYLEACQPLPVPAQLGTPGARNSRYTANAGPGIRDVSHSPVLPAVNEAVTVRARVQDPDGVGSVQLKYRLDPSATVNTLTMSNVGAGVYATVITGQPLGKLAAFYISATDSNAASTTLPDDAPVRECLIRWGELQNGSDFGTYRFWLTKSNMDVWAARAPLADEPLDMTLAYNNERVIYNADIRYRGSPFIRTWYSGPLTGVNSYVISPPKDDELLGSDEFNLDTLEPWESRDETRLRERTCFWVASQMGVPICYQRLVHIFLNGVQHSDVYSDSHHVDSDYIKTVFPDSTEGQLFKMDDWFEFGSAYTDYVTADSDLQIHTTTGGEKKKARYRWNWERKSNGPFDDSYSNLYALVDAANLTNAWYGSALESLADVDEWMKVFALRHVVVDWDGYSFRRGKNMFVYRPPDGAWHMLLWDLDMGLGASGESSNNCPITEVYSNVLPVVARMMDHPPFQRRYLQAVYDAVNGPLQSAQYEPFMDEWFEKMQQSGVGARDPAAVQSWLSGRRSFLLTSLSTLTNTALAITSNGGSDFSITSNLVTLCGSAPIQAREIRINGVTYSLTWTSVTNWVAYIALTAGTNTLTVQAYDSAGNALSGATDTIRVNYTGTTASPEGKLVINEILYHPATPDGGFVEIANLATNAYDLQGWRLDGVGLVFGESTVIRPGEYLVVADNAAVFASLYGTSIRVAAEYGGALNNGGETLKLLNTSSAVVDEVFFDDDPPWPTNADGSGPSLQLIDAAQDNNRIGNWAAATNGMLYTPGAANSVTSALPPFPRLWINELQATNVTGTRDNAGERDPWVELYNNDSGPLNLTNYYLTDSYTNLAKWAFRTNAIVSTGTFLIVWADAQTNQAVYMTNHASFRLATGTGSVALVCSNAGRLTIVDYMNYANITADRSFGDYPDGVWSNRVVFGRASAGATNNATSVATVYVNEWMADNDAVLADPVDGNYEDWFELYNASTGAVNLSGYTLTDTLSSPAKWTISNNVVIPAGGFLIVWADGEPAQNTVGGVHAGFSLAKGGEAIGLFTPEGVAVDTVTFGAQTLNVSQGRWWDGGVNIYTMAVPTPGTNNVVSTSNSDPVLSAIGSKVVNEESELEFQVTATDTDSPVQRLVFSLDPGAPAGATINPSTGWFEWEPGEDVGPLSTSVTIRVTDNGWSNKTDYETVAITVNEDNQPPSLAEIHDLDVGPGSLIVLAVSATDDDVPANVLTFSLEPGYPAGASVDAATGVFSWEPSDSVALSTNVIAVRVVDNGSPTLSAVTSFVIRVTGMDELFNAEVPGVSAANGFQVNWRAIPGETYRVACQESLLGSSWSNLPGDITATSSVASKVDDSTNIVSQRFYRILRLLR